MRKIRDSGRTYIQMIIPRQDPCERCDIRCGSGACENDDNYGCENDYGYRETLPSRLSRFIKRMARK